MTDERDLIIIGGGPAGYTAALYAARANLEPLVIEGFNWGGQLMITSDVENYPGFPDGVMGPEMMAEFRARRSASAPSSSPTTSRASTSPSARSASGSRARSTRRARSSSRPARAPAGSGSPGEQHLQGRGVSACATCDGAFFRDKELIVVGGGDTAMEEAIVPDALRDEGHDRPPPRRVPGVADHARPRPREREDRVHHERRDRRDPRRRQGRGGAPARHRARTRPGSCRSTASSSRSATTRTRSSSSTSSTTTRTATSSRRPARRETNVHGVFAAGDVQDHVYRQAVTAAGSGCMAALDAERWLAEEEGHEGSAPTAPRPEAAEV